MTTYTTEQVMLTLSLIADIGSTIEAGDCDAEHELYGPIEQLLQSYATVRGDWELVWGPCIFKFPLLAKYGDNTFFIVRNTQDATQYVVALSGTNPFEITDWVFEDFLVADMAPWKYGDPPHGANISLSAALSLSILQGVKPCAGIPGAGQQLMAFLKAADSGGGVSSVTVTGHSLGGEMASTVALWLADTQGDLWDSGKSATVNAYTYAAPTAGNARWAGYFDSRLGANTRRIWNPLDVVPYEWNVADLAKVAYLYLPDIVAPFWVTPFLAELMWSLEAQGYEQINIDQPPLQGGAVNENYPDFVSQMLYQHVQGYVDILQLPELTGLINKLSASAHPKKLL
jgi:hypothetical protein